MITKVLQNSELYFTYSNFVFFGCKCFKKVPLEMWMSSGT